MARRDDNTRTRLERDLAELKREEATSLMPSYRAVLSPTDLDDLVAYLASLRGEP